jgi:ribosomal protein S18 acetylase RimI-like enzyme
VETLSPANERLFRETLALTYEDTLDCPELNGRRTIEEIVEGHRHQGIHCPELWWLAFVGDEPVGVVILSELVGGDGWDLSYLGVVPAARRLGIGRALAVRALHEAHRARQPQLILAVDVRNGPALQLYRKIGFSAGEGREVLLFFMTDLADTGTSIESDERTASS